MKSKLEGFDVILTHGPPFVGKERFCRDNFSHTHKVIVPRLLYKEHSKFGIRDVALEAYKKLKEGYKVVLLDTNENRKTRESYIKLLKKKFSDLSLATVSILPQHGCQQLFWMREFHMVEESQCEDTKDSQCEDDELILKWFEKSSDVSVTYKYGTVDALRESEGSHIHQEVHGLQTASTYKFDLPALFVQWECLSSLQLDEGTALSEIVDIFNNWATANPCGRIIVICDGTQIRTGEKSRAQQTSDIQECIGKITAEFSVSPVFVHVVEKPLRAGSYVLPPNPGILAYLQKRHCLNLPSKGTVYIFETTAHMKMAEKAGVRHVKVSRLMKHPSLVTSSHAAVIPPIPEMLQHLTIEFEKEPHDCAKIPLYTRADQFKAGRIHRSLGYGRSEFLFACDWEIVERYQELYARKAKKVGVSGSAVSPVKLACADRSGTSPALSSNNNTGHSLVSRDLPKWMMSRGDSESSRSSLNSSLSTGSTVLEKKVRTSVYVMSEKELVEMATEILKQAGKSDLIETLQTEDTKTNEVSTKAKHKTTPRRKKRVSQEASNTDISETLSSVCPKMEVDDFDEYEAQSIVPKKKVKLSEFTTSAKHNRDTNSKNMKQTNENLTKHVDDVEDGDATGDKSGNLDDRRLCRSAVSKKIASTMLEDFLDTSAQRKPSPRKKTQMDLSSDYNDRQKSSTSTQKNQDLQHSRDTKNSPAKKKFSRQPPDLSVLDIFL